MLHKHIFSVLHCPLLEISGRFTWVRLNSHKARAIHFYQCVQYSHHVFKQSSVAAVFGIRNVRMVLSSRRLYGHRKRVCIGSTLRASLSGTSLQSLPDLVTPLKEGR